MYFNFLLRRGTIISPFYGLKKKKKNMQREVNLPTVTLLVFRDWQASKPGRLNEDLYVVM